jgi:vancomycin resistance protein YoaR
MSRQLTTSAKWGTGGVLGCVALGALALVIQVPSRSAHAGTAEERVTVEGVSVAGKSSEEIEKLAREYAARLLAYPVRVESGKRSTLTSPGKLGAKVDVEAAVAAAVEPRPPGSLLDRIRERFTGPEARRIQLSVEISEAGVAEGLKRFSALIGMEPKNARLTRVNGVFKATPPQPGKELDAASVASTLRSLLEESAFRDGLAASLEQQPRRAEWLKLQTPLKVTAATREAQARITLEHLKPITTQLASFGTSLGNSSRNRTHNVRLACQAIDGTVLLPGDVFSYNDTVGPRVESAGYKEAPVIVRGKLEPGTGGGICQVSSTLYNAALLADMEIVRRRHHAIPVAYLPAGRDATVVDGVIDFRFRNRLKYPVAIDSKVVGGRVVVNLYGHPDDKVDVSLVTGRVSKVDAGVKTIPDPKLPKGRRVVVEPPRSGTRVTLTRIVKKGGREIRKEIVSRDYYRPYDGIVRVGTRVQEKSPTETKDAEPPVTPETATDS